MLTVRERMVEMIRYFDWASARIIALAGTSVRADMVRPYRKALGQEQKPRNFGGRPEAPCWVLSQLPLSYPLYTPQWE